MYQRKTQLKRDISLIVQTLVVSFLLSGCAVLRQNPSYQGPPPRPDYLRAYYDQSGLFISAEEKVLERNNFYSLKQISIETKIGTTIIDYRQLSRASDELIFVFPINGGNNMFANYFAEYFTHKGYDTAIVHRDSEFKDPKNVAILEKLFRNNIIRDRIAIDYFETNYNKKHFGSFGISRGAINATTTAGVDPRLEVNVLALGATELTDVIIKSTDRSMKRFRKQIMKTQGISDDELKSLLKEQIVTSPDAVAKYINAKKTLVFLAIFDRTVPFRYGRKLKKQIGEPETVYLFANHYTALLYTQFIPLIPPYRPLAIFPFSYIESKSLALYNDAFERNDFFLSSIPLKISELPFDLFYLISDLFD